ncbi:MAG: hypothetical protein IJV00_00120 [Clostridia bacterium]|nr:hypothetical protein [Clostridia bacterium]
MKKIVSVVTLIAMLMSIFAVCALADPKDDIVAKANDVCPEGYWDEYESAIKNILNQIQVTQEQADVVTAAIEDARAIVNSGKGTRLDDYTDAEKDQVIGDLQTGCKALGIWYRIVEGEKATTVEFYVVDALDAQGNALAADKLLGSITLGQEGTVPDKTGPVGSTVAFVAAAAALVVLASAAFVAQKTKA